MTGTILCVNKSEFVPVIFEPTCTNINTHTSSCIVHVVLAEFNQI